MEIQLIGRHGTGHTTQVSPEDYDYLRQWRWPATPDCGKLRVRRGARINGRIQHFHMARVVLERKLGRPIRDGYQADHINGDTLNNQRENLREVTYAQNQMNSRKRTSSGQATSSQYKGVTRFRNKWHSTITINGRQTHLGTFDTPEEAHAAYLRAATHYFGEHARP
jgi:hypothetical protein